MANPAVAISDGGPSPGPKTQRNRVAGIFLGIISARLIPLVEVEEAHGLLAGEAGGAAADLFSKRTALLPPYTTGNVRFRSNLDIKLGRVIGGWQWRAADRRYASRCGHSSRGASGLGVAFVGALCRRIDSRGVDPRSLISSPGKARELSAKQEGCRHAHRAI
jgi:hypothetical protein